jgi:hypothetical protein
VKRGASRPTLSASVHSGVEHGARGADDDRPVRPPAGAHRGLGVAALRADARDQQRQRRRQFAHARDLGRVGGAHHQAQLAAAVPLAGGQPRDVLVQQPLAALQPLRLQVVAAGVGGAAQQDQALAVVAQVGLDRVEAHEGRQRHASAP